MLQSILSNSGLSILFLCVAMAAAALALAGAWVATGAPYDDEGDTMRDRCMMAALHLVVLALACLLLYAWIA